MNPSLRRQLFIALSTPIIAAGLIAATLSFWIAYRDANQLQDTQLSQVASVLTNSPLWDVPLTFAPKSNEEVETHLVIRRLGTPVRIEDPTRDLALPVSLPAGLQSIEHAHVRWRVMVIETTAGERFAVAQRMTVRDEVARDTALLTLLPLTVLIPILLFIVHRVLERGFAPMTAMSRQVDRLEGGPLTALEEGRVPLEALPLVQAFNRMLGRLGLVLEQRRRFVSDAAHELRTPVAALRVQADNAQHAGLSEEAAARLRILRQGLVRMSALIDQLLDFARVQGETATTAQPLRLDDMVRTAIEEILPLAHARRIDLGCPQLDPVRVTGDPLHARALLRNAIGNAVRYTPQGGSVDVSVVRSDAEVSLVVEDTGPGIPAEEVERVFAPFVRLLGHQEPGSGLGLAIASAAARALGGRIQLEERGDGRPGLRFVYRQALH